MARLDLGFADRIAEPVRIAAQFDVCRFRNAPPALSKPVLEADEDAPSGSEAATDVEAGDESAIDVEGEGALAPECLPADPDPPADMDALPVETDAVRAIAANIRAEALTHARAVVDLCRLAGQPQMAGRFLERDTGIDDVRAALLAIRAETEPDISAAHPQPGRPSGARPWGDVIARTFRLKG